MAKHFYPGASFAEFPRDELGQSIPGRFEQQVAKDPLHLAIHTKNHALTYQALNRSANIVAQEILRQRGTGQEPIALLLENDAPMIEAILGVLKAGKIYVPLDPSAPSSRLAYILQDTEAGLLITNSRNMELAVSLTGGKIVLIDLDGLDRRAETDNPVVAIPQDSLSWIIYTSGSTGQPKGVVQTHRNVLHFVRNYTNGLYLSSSDRLSVLFSFGVNGAAHEIFSGLLNGASLHPLDIKTEGFTGLANWLTDQRVTTYSSVPTVFRHFCETLGEEQFPDVRLVKLIGEPVSRREVDLYQKHFSRDSILINRLGSTETGTIRWYFIDKETRIDGTSVPVGYPVADNEVILLNEDKKQVAAGEIGEIAVRSRYLSPGYWRKPEQTSKAFLPNPEGTEGRIYLTGDMGRLLPDGCLLHMGRKDFQVKIRGHRIETAEIEMALLSISQAEAAIVMARDDGRGESKLVAYLLMSGRGKADISSVRHELAGRLPDYMIPSVFMMLDSFPVAPNGKVNRGALPLPDSSRPEVETPFVAPSNPVERQIAQIWSDVLGVNPIGIHDDFFELGGHSLAAAQVVSRVVDKFQSEVTIASLFQAPTVAGMANNLGAVGIASPKLIVPPMQRIPRTGELPLSLAQERLWFLDQLIPDSSGYNILSAIRLEGSLQPAILQRAIDAVIMRHETLRTAFVERDGRPVQLIAETVTASLPLIDLNDIPESEREAEVKRLAMKEAESPFDLRKTPFRAKLFRLSVMDCVLVTVVHHIVSDGWSMGVFARDLFAYYEAFSQGKSVPLPDLAIQYVDFAVWQREWLQADRLEQHISYWRQRLAGTLPVSELPVDRPRPSNRTYHGAKNSNVLPSQTSAGLKSLSRQEQGTMFMTLLSAFIAFIHHSTGQEDILIGTDVANRSRVESENLIGFFVNLLPIRVDVSGNPSFRELLHRVRDTVLEGYEHQDLPFDRLVAELNPRRDPSRNPLFQILFVMQNQPNYGALSGMTAKAFEVDSRTARFDLVVFVTESKGQLTTTWNYNTDLFDSATIVRMMRQYQTLLEGIVASADRDTQSLAMVIDHAKEPEDTSRLKSRESKLRGLRASTRKPIPLSRLQLVNTSYFHPGERLPLVIQPATNGVDLIPWAKDNLEYLEKELLNSGAILFRGFALNSVSEFENFAAAICPELFVDYGDLPREQVNGRVYDSTPYPSDRSILFHNESSHMHQWPMKQWFFCVQAARSGGETPIVDCRKLYERIDREILKRFEEKRIMYVRNFTPALDVRWQDFFKTNDRSVVDRYCQDASIEMEWKDGDRLRIRHISSVVTKHPKTGEMVWFNQAQLWHLSCLDANTRESLLALFGEDDLPRNCYYGDGSAIEDSVIGHITEVYRATSAAFQWREHDILMLDNMLVAHARNPYEGPRKIVVAMGEMMK